MVQQWGNHPDRQSGLPCLAALVAEIPSERNRASGSPFRRFSSQSGQSGPPASAELGSQKSNLKGFSTVWSVIILALAQAQTSSSCPLGGPVPCFQFGPQQPLAQTCWQFISLAWHAVWKMQSGWLSPCRRRSSIQINPYSAGLQKHSMATVPAPNRACVPHMSKIFFWVSKLLETNVFLSHQFETWALLLTQYSWKTWKLTLP